MPEYIKDGATEEEVSADHRLREAIETAEIEGASRWWDSGERQVMEAGGYQHIASALPADPKGVHIDLGSGFGGLLATLWRQYPDRPYFGLEINQHTLVAAFDRLNAAGIPTKQYGGIGVARNANTGIPVRIGTTLLPGQTVELDEPGIHLLRDDIRYADTISRILGNRRIASGSFTFPGFAESLALDLDDAAPVTASHDNPKIRLMVNEVRKAAFRFMEKHLMPGGHFLIADRLLSITSPEAIVRDIVKRNATKKGALWKRRPVKIGSGSTFRVDGSPERNLGIITPEGRAIQTSVHDVIWFVLRRNQSPFKP